MRFCISHAPKSQCVLPLLTCTDLQLDTSRVFTEAQGDHAIAVQVAYTWQALPSPLIDTLLLPNISEILMIAVCRH